MHRITGGPQRNFIRSSQCFSQQLYLSAFYQHVIRISISLTMTKSSNCFCLLYLNYGHLCRCAITMYLNMVLISFHLSTVMLNMRFIVHWPLESVQTLCLFFNQVVVFLLFQSSFCILGIRTLIRQDLQIIFLKFYELSFTFLTLL